MLLGICCVVFVNQGFTEETLSKKHANEYSIALTQAFLKLPPSYIGGVALEDRAALLGLLSHYGDIDYANGHFRLGGDGARAHDKPSSEFFEIKLIPREEAHPLCVIATGAVDKPVAVISFESWWTWSDVTDQYFPKDTIFDQPVSFRLNSDSFDVVVRTSGQKEMVGKFIWEDNRYQFQKYNEAEFFLSAIRQLDPKFIGDIPLNKREVFIRKIQNDSERFDSENHWLHYFSDNSRDGISATSMVWAKLLLRTHGDPYVFVHMAKPMANGKAPVQNQTFVFSKQGNNWTDITSKVIPHGVDLTGHFRPLRKPIIETGSWQQIERSDGLGQAWIIGARTHDLVWSSWRGALSLRKAKAVKFTAN